MYILDYLVQLVSKAQEPRQMVELAMRAIAIDLGARSCRLFIRKHGSELVLSESFGAHANLEEAKAGEELAREALLNVLLSGADTPTASWRAAPLVSDLASEVDFFSIGTNDLIQYSLVVDREDPRLSSPHHAFHPAIWRMIQRVIATARTAEKEVNCLRRDGCASGDSDCARRARSECAQSHTEGHPGAEAKALASRPFVVALRPRGTASRTQHRRAGARAPHLLTRSQRRRLLVRSYPDTMASDVATA